MSSRYRWSGTGRILGSPRPKLHTTKSIPDRRRHTPHSPSPEELQLSDDPKSRRRQLRKRSKLANKEPSAAYLALHPLSSLERLPTELLHRIFYDAASPALAGASLSLAYIFQSRHLQFNYIRGHSEELSSLVSMRFFTLIFLEEYESRYGEIDATHVSIPSSLSAPPWRAEKLLLLRTLISRGASCEGELDHHRENMLDAIRAGRGEAVVNALLTDPSFRPDATAVEVAIRSIEYVDDCLRLCAILVDDGGAQVEPVNVWKAALSRHENEFVQFLLKRAAPPVEVLGQLAAR